MSNEPDYLRIYEAIHTEIAAGAYPGGRLPSERTLMKALQGTRITVREALMRLERESVIYRLNRRGWFVAPPRIRYSPHHKSHFIQTALSQGRHPETRVLSSENYLASGEEAHRMGLEQGALGVNKVVRLRELDGHPVLYESIWLNANLTPELLSHALEQSLTELMRRQYQIEIRRTDVRVRPCVLTDVIAERLLVRDGTPGLLIIQKRYNQYGSLVEYDQEFWRHDVIELDMKFGEA